MPPVSRRAVLAGAALTTAALIVPITVRRSRAAERDDGYEITDWIVIGSSGEVTHRVRGAAAAARRRSLYTDDEFVARVGWATAFSPLPTRRSKGCVVSNSDRVGKGAQYRGSAEIYALRAFADPTALANGR
jgi:hypothetical protein